jgi:Tfp pilus assembly protein PilF
MSRCIVRIASRSMIITTCGVLTLSGCTGWFSSSPSSWFKTKSSSTTTSISTTSTDATTASSSGLFAKKQQPTPELYIATAQLCESRGDFTAAATQYESALKQSPNNVPALLSYAHLMDHQGKLAEATKLYERAVKANPKEAAAYNDLGLCLARRGMAAEAQTNFAKAVQLQPDKQLYRNNYATLLVDQHKPDEALIQLKAVNSEAIANYDIGILLEQHQQNALAQAHFQRALELDPTFAEARQWCQQLAQAAPPAAPPVQAMVAQPTANQLRVASVTPPTTRAASYGTAPEPVASNYMPPPTPAANSAPDRYAPLANPAVVPPPTHYAPWNAPGIPPTPESFGNNSGLHALPPVTD